MRLSMTGRLIWILAAACLAATQLSPGDARAGGGGQQTVTITGADICANATGLYPASGDYDRDGLTNAQECAGMVRNETGGPYVTITGYANRGVNSRADYLDPSQIDLFVWLEPALPTNLPAGAVSVYTDGLGAAAHLIGSDNVGSTIPSTVVTDLYRAVTAVQGQLPGTYSAAQKAVRVTEDLDATLKDAYGRPLELAVTNWGTPNGSGEVLIYTDRIKQTVASKCAGYTCRDYAGTTGLAAVQDLYIRHTTGHELGHTSKLTRTTDAAGNHHYAAESYTVMESSVAAKATKGGNMTFWISTGFVAADKTDAKTGGY